MRTKLFPEVVWDWNSDCPFALGTFDESHIFIEVTAEGLMIVRVMFHEFIHWFLAKLGFFSLSQWILHRDAMVRRRLWRIK